MLHFTSAAAINSFYWICSLDPSKKGTTSRVIEDLEPFLNSSQIKFKYFEPKSADDLETFLTKIEEETSSGAKPLIHLDTHGSKNDGIVIASTNEFISWQKICNNLRAINILSGNNLCLGGVDEFATAEVLGIPLLNQA
jgi:hypothetical protein